MADSRAQLQELHDAWHAAELAVATGQSYAIAGRTLTRADAAEIHRLHMVYEGRLDALDGVTTGGSRAIGIIPVDV